MSLFSEAVDIIDQLASSVDNMQKLAEAVRTGIGYLEKNHPEATRDLLAMCDEISHTLDALAGASAVVTRFAFNVSGGVAASEARAFNNYYVDAARDAAGVRNQIEELRGHCHAIRQHADAMAKEAAGSGLGSLFNLLGIRSAKREQELAERLGQIYNEEMELYLTVDGMSRAVELAFKDVQNTLGPPGQMLDENVPAAAQLLGKYAVRFGALQSECLHAGTMLKQTIREVAG